MGSGLSGGLSGVHRPTNLKSDEESVHIYDVVITLYGLSLTQY